MYDAEKSYRVSIWVMINLKTFLEKHGKWRHVSIFPIDLNRRLKEGILLVSKVKKTNLYQKNSIPAIKIKFYKIEEAEEKAALKTISAAKKTITTPRKINEQDFQ